MPERSPFSCAESRQLSAISHQPSVRGFDYMRDFHGLKVWQKAHALTLSVYRLTKSFPADERYGLTSQLRRAASSIAANLAEGCGRGGEAEFARFTQIAMGSAAETEYHLLLAKDLGYITEEHFHVATTAVQEIKRMLASLLKTVREQTDG